MKKILISLLFLPIFLFSQTPQQIDSVLGVYKKTNIDTVKIKLLNTLSKMHLVTGDFDAAISFSNQGITLSTDKLKKIKSLTKREDEIFNIGLAESYLLKGMTLSDKGDYKNAKLNLNNAINVYKKNNDKKGLSRSYNNLANIECDYGNYTESIKNHLASIKIKEAMGDVVGIASSLGNLGNVYVIIGKPKEARENYNLALASFIKEDNKLGIGNMLSGIALTCEDDNKYDSAIYFLNEAQKYRIEINDLEGLSGCYENMAGVYYKQEKFDLAIVYFKKTIELREQMGDSLKLGTGYMNLAAIYSDIGRDKEALESAEKGFEIIKQINSIEQLCAAYGTLTTIHAKAKDYKRAFEYSSLYTHAKDSLAKINNVNVIQELSTKYETEKKETENKLLQTENALSNETIEQQKTISMFIIIGLIIVSILAFFIFRGLKKQRKANKIISEQKELVEIQKEIVEEKHKEITDSINYAERIQRALLANKKILDENIADYFILFKPKDVVSGDFYWATKLVNGHFVIVTADSTGHGVPGAIMSILNIACLKEAVSKGIDSPELILNETRRLVIENLMNDGSSEGGKDGMDGSLLSFDFKNNIMHCASANNPIWIIRGHELIEIKGDRMPIGKHTNDKTLFSLHTQNLQKGDVVYTLTDGFADQFGGENGKKFKYKQLQDLLLSVHEDSMEIQKHKLNTVFNTWKGNLEQIDDVCIIGVRI